MIAFALQAAAAREMTRRTDERAADAPDLLRVFHPPGVIRLVTPAEQAAMEGRARSAVPARHRAEQSAQPSRSLAIAWAAEAVRRLGRIWANTQMPRAQL